MGKHLLMTSVNGVNRYACKKCGAEMKPVDNYSIHECNGDVIETGGEFLQCTNPDCMITSNYPEMHVRDFKLCRPEF